MTGLNGLETPRTGAVFDELLVMLAQQGDRKALARLHKRWDVRLRRAARRYTGDAEIAQDLTQECWLAIWKGLGRLQHPAKFPAYAFGVLHRRGADHLRRTIRTRTQETGSETVEQSQRAQQEDGLAIRQAFAELPPDQRLAAHLYFVEGLTIREIATVQSIIQGTAKSRLFYARQKLKAALSDKHEPTKETSDD